jgi:biopolymer transport protein ExbB
MWVLETVVTAAPLMGLLGTITGMMQAFKAIGGAGLVAPTQVTSGVAQALIATALGLLIALFALFGYNFFSRVQSHAMDQMERLGSRLVDHVPLSPVIMIGALVVAICSIRLLTRLAPSELPTNMVIREPL